MRSGVARALLALLVSSALAACGQSTQGSVVPPPLEAPGATSTGTPQSDPPSALPSLTPSLTPSGSAAGPTVTRWGRDGRLLSVVVRNDDPEEIVYARVRVTVVSTGGQVILSTVGQRFSKATTILGLPSGESYGLVLTLPRGAPAVGEVLTTYVQRSLRPTRARPALRIGASRLRHRRTGAVVSVRFTATGSVPPVVGAQAFLVDPHGALVAVISGRFYCFGPTTRRTLHMQLLRPVPPHTRIETVRAYPVPRGAPLPLPSACR